MNDNDPMKITTDMMKSKKPAVSAAGAILALVYLFLLGGLCVASIKLLIALESCK